MVSLEKPTSFKASTSKTDLTLFSRANKSGLFLQSICLLNYYVQSLLGNSQTWRPWAQRLMCGIFCLIKVSWNLYVRDRDYDTGLDDIEMHCNGQRYGCSERCLGCRRKGCAKNVEAIVKTPLAD